MGWKKKKNLYNMLCFILVESMICKSILAILISSYFFGVWGKPARCGTCCCRKQVGFKKKKHTRLRKNMRRIRQDGFIICMPLSGVKKITRKIFETTRYLFDSGC